MGFVILNFEHVMFEDNAPSVGVGFFIWGIIAWGFVFIISIGYIFYKISELMDIELYREE